MRELKTAPPQRPWAVPSEVGVTLAVTKENSFQIHQLETNHGVCVSLGHALFELPHESRGHAESGGKRAETLVMNMKYARPPQT